MRMSTLYLAALGLLLAGCGGVICDHPLSNEEDSVLDERLIGVWEGIPGERSKGDQPRLYVGRQKGAERAHEAVWVQLDDDQHLEVKRLHVFATRLGGNTYVTLADAEQEKQEYLLLRYEIDDENRMSVWYLDEEKVVEQIRSEAIAGSVKENPKYDTNSLEGLAQQKYDEVRISAPTKTLRAWLEAAAPKVLTPLGDGRIFRKLVFEKQKATK